MNCPICGEPLRPVYKTKEGRQYVSYWMCDNPNCLVTKVFSRMGPRRIEVEKAHAL